jgi:peptide/nickel transport system substrate-binding protein
MLFALASVNVTNITSVEKIYDHTVAVNTPCADSRFPYQINQVLLISRCRLQALNKDNKAYAMQPSGTGPYRFSRMVPHERLELVPNPDAWDRGRMPKHDRLMLLPVPEPRRWFCHRSRQDSCLVGSWPAYDPAPGGGSGNAVHRV